VVVPLYNEEQIVPALIERSVTTLTAIGVPFEIVAVDDGSSDRTREALRECGRTVRELRVVCLSRNFGLQGAVAAGLSMASGDVVVLMDGDLQDPPELIPQLLERWQAGADVVYTTKLTRAERGPKRLAIEVFHRLVQRVSETPLPLGAGNFSLMDRRAVDAIKNAPERNRYFPGLRSWVGFRQEEVTFDRDARAAGKARMSLARLFKLAFDGIFGFSHLPLRIATIVGAIASCLGLLFVVWVLIERFVSHTAILGWPSLMIAVCFLGGAQLLGIGVLGEYVARIYDEARGRPDFIISEVVQFDGEHRLSPP
jgi:dolichol-phosphate mannosyltransferase